MDVSHIHRVLGCFTKSHVSVPIKSNAFEETYECIAKVDDKSGMLDDMISECRKRLAQTPKNRPAPVVHEVERQSLKTHYLEQLFFVLCCVKDPLMTLKGLDKSALTKMKHDLLAFVENTQVKTLDMVKYKYTKKGLREILTKCITADVDGAFDWLTVRAVLVVAVRHLRKGITLQIKGETKEIFPLPPSMTEQQNGEQVTINYDDVNNEFIMV